MHKSSKKLALAPNNGSKPKFIFSAEERAKNMKGAYESGDLRALRDVFRMYLELQGKPPSWALWGALTIIEERLKKGKPQAKGGPGANDVAAARWLRTHFRRWQLVVAVLPTAVSPTSAYKIAAANLKSVGEHLVGWEAVRDSYKQVEEDRQKPGFWQKYYRPLYGDGGLGLAPQDEHKAT